MLQLKKEKTRQISFTEELLPKELLGLDGGFKKFDELYKITLVLVNQRKSVFQETLVD